VLEVHFLGETTGDAFDLETLVCDQYSFSTESYATIYCKNDELSSVICMYYSC
jgi:hypothetical protein